MPKLVLKLFTETQNYLGQERKLHKRPISDISITNLEITFLTQDLPVSTLIHIELESLTIKDPTIKEVIKKLNPEMPADKEQNLIEYVLETQFGQNEDEESDLVSDKLGDKSGGSVFKKSNKSRQILLTDLDEDEEED